MKVAFWSNLHGQSGTTSNMIGVGIISALSYNSKVFLGQSHYNLNNLEDPFLGISREDKKTYFMNVGIDAIVRAIKSIYLDEETIENCTLSFLNKRLMLLPSTVKTNQKIYEEDIDKTIVSILEAMDKYYDMVFIDVNTRGNAITRKIIDNVDLLVVNLSQNLNLLNDYEENFLEKFQDKNVFYIFGNYNPNSSYSLSNLRKTYTWLKTKNIGIIPYNTEFMDSMSDGKIIQFFFNNLNSEAKDPNYYFINELKGTTSSLYDLRFNKRR